VLTRGVARPQRRDQLRAVVASVVSDVSGQLAERLGESLHGDGLLARRLHGHLGDDVGHQHLGAAAAIHGPRLLDRLRQHAQSVVQRAVSLVQDLLGGAAKHNCARLAQLDAGELEQLLLTNHDLLDERALAQLDRVRRVEVGADLAAQHERQPLHALEVGVLNRHDAGVGEQLLGVVVDQLSVDEDIGAVFDDPVDFVWRRSPPF